MNLRFPFVFKGENAPKEQMMSCIIEYSKDNPETQCCPKMKYLDKQENVYFNAESIKHTIIFVLAVLILKGLELFGMTLLHSTFCFLSYRSPLWVLPFIFILWGFGIYHSQKDIIE